MRQQDRDFERGIGDMKVVINSVGVNPEKTAIIIKEVNGADDEYAELIIKQINDGKKYSFDCLSHDDAIDLSNRLKEAGAEVEIEEDTVLDKIFNKLSKPLDKIIGWHEGLYKKNKIPAIVLFVIEAILVVLLIFKYWVVLFALLLVLGLVEVYTNKKDHTDTERESTTKMFKQMGKWIAICIVVFLLVKPVSGIINRFMPSAIVRNSYFVSYSDEITIGEAFENVFTKYKWSTYSHNDNKYVRFTGDFTTDEGETSTYQFDFLVRGDSCTIDSIYINGIDVSDMETVLLVGIYNRNGVNW